MAFKNKKLQYFYLVLSLFISGLFTSFVYANGDSESFITPKRSASVIYSKNTCSVNRRTICAYNGSAWAGAGFLFVNSSLQPYVNDITMDYQIGVSKSFWNVTPYDFFYVGLIADFAYSKRYLGAFSGLNYDALYYFSNEQLVLGYEQTLGTPYLSAFLEAGGAFQQRYFAIRENTTSGLIDYVFMPTFGGTFNAGLNVNLLPERYISYFFRLAMNFMVGPRGQKTLNFNGDPVNANQLSYSPSVSFGVRM